MRPPDCDQHGYERQQTQQAGDPPCRDFEKMRVLRFLLRRYQSAEPFIGVEQQPSCIMSWHGADHNADEQDHTPGRDIGKLDEQILGLRSQSKQEQSECCDCHRDADDPEDQRALENALPKAKKAPPLRHSAVSDTPCTVTLYSQRKIRQSIAMPS